MAIWDLWESKWVIWRIKIATFAATKTYLDSWDLGCSLALQSPYPEKAGDPLIHNAFKCTWEAEICVL